eukprot:m.290773 g.290773  ORF g.290773 m.290773 type:complete len:779 (+) comp19471_c0_seq4:679-3015(+)
MRKRTVATAAAALTDASAPSAASAADETVSDETSSGMEQDPKHTDGVAADSGIEQPRPKQPPVDRKVTVKINVALVLLTLAAVATRMWRIGTPSKVVFDEVHFRRFASHYIKREFFFDVHPPLGKLLLAVAGLLGNLDPATAFTAIGQDFVEHGDTSYMHMRMLSAMFGIAIVPMVYQCVVELGFSHVAALLAGGFVLLDNAVTLQSRLILLDAQLMFFAMATFLALLKFSNQRVSPFRGAWWFWLVVLGVCLGCCVSVKFVGLFTMALVGVHTVTDLWRYLGEQHTSLVMLLGHFAARVAALILLPIAVYVALFGAHLAMVPNTGPGDPFVSTAFQATLEGSPFATRVRMPKQMVYGADVMLRHVYQPRVWLHSHPYKYPSYPAGEDVGLISSQQQQVTGFGQRDDDGNWWRVEPTDGVITPEGSARVVSNGDVIRLVHLVTNKTLNSHDVAAPVTPSQMEVSCYGPSDMRVPPGEVGHMPLNDKFKIQLVGSPDQDPNVLSLRSQFRLTHVHTQGTLQLTGKRLPDWGFRQYEVSANRQLEGVLGVWQVGNNRHAGLPSEEVAVELGLSFWQKFVELHRAMLAANNQLTVDHDASSRPWEWPFVRRGIPYWWSEPTASKGGQIYLLGNPVVWWACVGGLGVYSVLEIVYAVRRQRGHFDVSERAYTKFYTAGRLCAGGWVLHYGPFFLMQRQLFLHHYLPALLFSVVLTASMVEHVLFRVLRVRRGSVMVGIVALLLTASATSFAFFAPMTYGTTLDGEAIERRRWFSRWSFYVPA